MSRKDTVDKELQRQSTSTTWGKQAVQIMQLPGMGFVVAMTVLAAIGDISRFENAKQLVGYAGIGATLRTDILAGIWYTSCQPEDPQEKVAADQKAFTRLPENAKLKLSSK